MKPRTTCYACEHRYPGCHDTCVIYQKAKIEKDEKAQKRRQEKALYYTVTGHNKFDKRRGQI